MKLYFTIMIVLVFVLSIGIVFENKKEEEQRIIKADPGTKNRVYTVPDMDFEAIEEAPDALMRLEHKYEPGIDSGVIDLNVPESYTTATSLAFVEFGHDAGTLSWKGGKLTFKGDADESAKIFFKHLIEAYMEPCLN